VIQAAAARLMRVLRRRQSRSAHSRTAWEWPALCEAASSLKVDPDILMTVSQIPDVNRELAEVGEMFAVFDAIRRTRER